MGYDRAGARPRNMKSLCLFVVLLLLPGCRCDRKLEPQKGRPGAVVRVSKRDKVRKPQQTKMLAGAAIVIAYKGARGASATVKRTRTEAEQLARQVRARLKDNSTIFSDLARKHSDSLTARLGGELGGWPRGRMPAIEPQLERLKIGEVSNVFHTPAGYQIVKRQIAILAASQIVVAFRGARGAARTVMRNRTEARKLAEELYQKLKTNPESFFFVARKQSDHAPSARAGGRLGVWPRGRKPAIIESTVDSLEIGQIARPVQTPAGYVILQRDDPYPNR